MDTKRRALWILLFLVSGVLYYLMFGDNQTVWNLSGSKFRVEEVRVFRIIDGDTVELNDSRKVRLLGINAPETGKNWAEEARIFLKNFENQTLSLSYKETDKYGRTLGYLESGQISLNEMLAEKGLAHMYYYEPDGYYERIKHAEERARQERKGIWMKSNRSGCIELVELRYQESTRCKNQERLILRNTCDEFSVLIKDDATHEFEERIPQGLFAKNFSCIFNDAGDSLFISDDSGLLVFFRYP
jgi:micrococcal nuclease